jgi:hypothetical protein
MGDIRPTKPAKLFAGLLSNDPDLMKRAAVLLAEAFGQVETVTETWPFDSTDYYTPEMGSDLLRQFVSFVPTIHPHRLADIKRQTNELEKQICTDAAADPNFRLVNIDPGYLTLSKMILATTKDYSHRIYLSQGIYAETTLHYESGNWTAWPWTYPDYAAGHYFPFFTTLRENLKAQISESKTHE